MKTYIGTKVVEAKPAMKDDQDGYAVRYPDGYTSWSPAHAFRVYQPTDAMSFGHALEAMKLGHRVARAAWNGDFSLRRVYAEVSEVLLLKDRAGVVLSAAWVPTEQDMLTEDWALLL